MQKRKKKELDGIDREILRLVYKREFLVGSKIAALVGLSASAISPRLFSLMEKGIIKQAKLSKERVFIRFFGKKKVTIHSPRRIYWQINFKDEQK